MDITRSSGKDKHKDNTSSPQPKGKKIQAVSSARRPRTSTPQASHLSTSPDIDKSSFIKSLQLINSDGSTDEERTDSITGKKELIDQGLLTDNNLSIEEYYWKGPFQNTSVHDTRSSSKTYQNEQSASKKQNTTQSRKNSASKVKVNVTTKNLNRSYNQKSSKIDNTKNVFDIMKFAASQPQQSKTSKKNNDSNTKGKSKKDSVKSGISYESPSTQGRKRQKKLSDDIDDPKSDFTDTASDIEVITISNNSVTFSKPKRQRGSQNKNQDKNKSVCTPTRSIKEVCSSKLSSSEKRRKTLYSFKEKFSDEVEVDNNQNADSSITETWMEIGNHLANIAQSLGSGDQNITGTNNSNRKKRRLSKSNTINNNQHISLENPNISDTVSHGQASQPEESQSGSSPRFLKSPSSRSKLTKKRLSDILPKPIRGKAKRKLLEGPFEDESFVESEADDGCGKSGDENKRQGAEPITTGKNLEERHPGYHGNVEVASSYSIDSTFESVLLGTESNKLKSKSNKVTSKLKQNNKATVSSNNDTESQCLTDVHIPAASPQNESLHSESRTDVDTTGTQNDSSELGNTLRSKRTRRSAIGLTDYVQPMLSPRKGRGKRTPRKELKVENDQGREFVCSRCGSNFQALNHLKQHLMFTHNALWSKDCPEGLTDWKSLTTIIKKIGKLNCPKCGKEIRYMHYYKKHVEWCGRENEKYFCELCKKYIMVMWEHEHKLMHIRKDKMEEMDREKEASLAETNDNSEEVSTDKKRSAARKAERLLMALSRSFDGHTIDISSDDNDPDAKVESESSDDDDYNEEDNDEIIGDFIDEDEKEEIKVAYDSKHMYTGIHFVNNFNRNLEYCKEMDRYNNVQFPQFCPMVPDWNPLSDDDSQCYLPCIDESAEFCISSQKQHGHISERTKLKMFEAKSFKENSIFFVGGPVWGLAWCPMPHNTRNQSQYLAVSCHMTMDTIQNVTDIKEEPCLIQIWNTGKLNQSLQSLPSPKLEYSIAHDYGVVRQMVWCPFRSWQSPDHTVEEDSLLQIGLLAAACGDGSIRIFSIPSPDKLPHEDRNQPLVYQPCPVVTLVGHKLRRCKLPGCTSVSWSDTESRYLLGGYGDGSVRLWDLLTTSSLLSIQTPDQGLLLLPFRTFIPHFKPVTCVNWCPHSSKYFMTTSLDRYMKTWSVDNLVLPLTTAKSSALTTGIWPSNVQSVVYSDDDVYVPGKVHIRIQSYGDLRDRNRAVNAPLQTFIHGVWDLSVSNWHSMLLGCDFHGNLVATYYPAVHGEKKPHKSRMLLSKVKLIPKSSNSPESSMTNQEPEKETGNQTYQDTVDKYYIEVTQNMTIQRKLVFDKEEQKLNEFPLLSVHRVEINPNLESCMFVASGGQAGLVQIHNVNKCIGFHAARDLRQELRLGT